MRLEEHGMMRRIVVVAALAAMVGTSSRADEGLESPAVVAEPPNKSEAPPPRSEKKGRKLN